MNRKRASAVSDPVFGDNTTYFFMDLSYRAKKKMLHYKETCRSRFQVESWESMYRSVTYAQINGSRMKRSLSYFGMMNLFLFLAHKMKRSCNLTLSCQLFREFTGYPGFCDKSFPHLKNKTVLRTKDDPLKKEISLYLDNLYKKCALSKVDTLLSADEQFDDIDRLEKLMAWNYEQLYGDLCKTCTPKEMRAIMKAERDETDGVICTPLDIALDRYIMFFIDALKRRNKKTLCDNKWAEMVWSGKHLRVWPE